MLAVEMVWLDVLVEAGIAPPDARADLTGLIEDYHEEWLVEETEAGHDHELIDLLAKKHHRN